MRRMLEKTMVGLVALSMAACAGESANDSSGAYEPSNSFNNVNNTDNGSGANNGGFDEPEIDFDFAEPTVIGSDVYVANRSLNSVAVIDSETLLVRTVPVGFEPTLVTGPTEASTEASRVFVLNEGSGSVTVIGPGGERMATHRALRLTNQLVSGPLGRSAIGWVDAADVSPADVASGRIDLSAVVIFREDAAFQISVGFNIREIHFSDDGESILVLSDDGVSVIKPHELDDDGIAIPTPYLPTTLPDIDADRLETLVSSNGRYVISRTATILGLVLLDLEDGTHHVVELSTTPTDLDWVGDDRVLATIGQESLMMLATVPDGLIAAAAASIPAPMPSADMGMPIADMGGDDAGTSDAGTGDTDMADMGMADMDTADMGMADAGPDDAGVPDMATGTQDMGTLPTGFVPPFEAEGVEWAEVPVPALRLASVDPTGRSAFVYTNVAAERRAVLVDLDGFKVRGLSFEKGMIGAVAGPTGSTFVVYHNRVDEQITPDLTPADPEYIERSWAISLVDVASGASRLVLTQYEPGPASLYVEDEIHRLYMLFGGMNPTARPRTVLSSDLTSFATSSFDLASPPETVGAIYGAQRVFISQNHPQGRITLVEVDNDDRRQTITGYQLNARID